MFHASISTASVRLPDVPAHYVWLACDVAAVLAILYFDRRLGYAKDAPAGPIIVSAAPTPVTSLHN
jgi:hypothetical protein